MKEMPTGRPDDKQHSKATVFLGVVQGLMLTFCLFLLFMTA